MTYMRRIKENRRIKKLREGETRRDRKVRRRRKKRCRRKRKRWRRCGFELGQTRPVLIRQHLIIIIIMRSFGVSEVLVGWRIKKVRKK
jgi:hypothetical protein